MTLLVAATLSVLLWFIPYAEVLTYPFRIFVTFIHEGGHALAALLTGNSVASLSVAMNASGETYTSQGGLVSNFFIASAGYLGAMAYGALLLVLIRKAIAARIDPHGRAVRVSQCQVVHSVHVEAAADPEAAGAERLHAAAVVGHDPRPGRRVGAQDGVGLGVLIGVVQPDPAPGDDRVAGPARSRLQADARPPAAEVCTFHKLLENV